MSVEQSVGRNSEIGLIVKVRVPVKLIPIDEV
jgi:hypothetical protein